MILAVILVIFALVCFFSAPYAVGVILAAAPAYLIRYSWHGVPTTFLELLLLIFLAVTFLKNFAKIPSLKNRGAINWLIGTFVLAGVISSLVSPDKHAALGLLKAFIIEPVLFFYAAKLVLNKPGDLTTPLNLLFLSAIIVSVYGILQYFTFIHLPLRFWGTGDELERITSVFDYPNALALYLAPIASFFFAGFVFGGRVLNRKNLFIGLLIMLMALVLTLSRGAYFGFAVAVLVILSLKYPIKNVLASALVILLVLFAVPKTRERLLLIAHDPSSSAHTSLMLAAAHKLEQSPLLGNGLFGFRTTLMQQNFPGEILNYPHNIILNFWLEMGLLGLVSFFGIVYLSAKHYKINPAWYKTAALAYMVALLVHGLVDVPYFKNDLSILFWFVVSILYV